jgi:hypothetical protein
MARHLCFTPEVSEKLRYYVYRLIDPRNGETFYVGKGKGNRVFHHVAGELKASELEGDADEEAEKLKRIRRIRNRGFEVAHVIHRHDMDEGAAFEVEAALIDAYPGLTNSQRGHAANECGPMHAKKIIELYAARP